MIEEQVPNKKDTIISISKKYDFYSYYISANIDLWKYELYKWGFMIWGENHYAKGMFNIEYIFITPQYRRQKIFTKIFYDLKKRYDVISFTTSEYSMVRFANKEKLINMGKTTSGDALWYVWSEIYSKEQIKVVK
jgi:hypothetical protein